MGFDKLVAPFAGEPLARRVARALAELRPLVVATPAIAAVLADEAGVDVVVTEPTAGPSETLRIADAATERDRSLAVLPCDLPFIDAARVRAFVARVPDAADVAWPIVRDVPGHPVLWSPRARSRIARLAPDAAPMRVRDDPALRALAIVCDDVAYVTDVDTPDAWAAAEARATSARR